MVIITITAFVLIAAIIFIPKRISYLEMYTTSLFAAFLGSFVDLYLDVKLHLYGFLTKGVNWGYIFILLIIYPAANILYLNFYPYQSRMGKKALYIISWSLVILCFEYFALQTKIFYYGNWRLGYSAILYPFILMLLTLNHSFIRKLSRN
ncbi:hypothetical protein D1B31_08260 [Neobacillus notoginsengisoli]|uniref:Rod shape-determining protein MreD n=1 Tax=Neobacillus notoginsengisoli TaxID=1578198 RepID=A0A417YWG4_9BACI|nr:CBO0543 family protein [Neobacillus notoginsengisoli]RHW41695.1 hypothetical protein D1B31_08260 [Neobacillus notoginsengisoli]